MDGVACFGLDNISVFVTNLFPMHAAGNAETEQQGLHVRGKLPGGGRIKRRLRGTANEAITGPKAAQEEFDILIRQLEYRRGNLFRSRLPANDAELFRPAESPGTRRSKRCCDCGASLGHYRPRIPGSVAFGEARVASSAGTNFRSAIATGSDAADRVRKTTHRFGEIADQ